MIGNPNVRSAKPSHIPRLQRSTSLHVKRSDSQDVLPNAIKKGCFQGTPNSLLPLRRSHSFSTSINRCKDSKAMSDDDVSSVKSLGSCTSLTSTCDLDSIKNGSVSGRISTCPSQSNGCCKKYVLHCQRTIQPMEETYLTPTQKKEKQIRQLKAALVRVTRGCEEKSSEVERLASEVERLRFSCHSSETERHFLESRSKVLEEDPSFQKDTPEMDQSINSRLEVGLTEILQPESKIDHKSSLEDSGILSDLLDPISINPPLNINKLKIRNFCTDSNDSSDDMRHNCSRGSQTETARKYVGREEDVFGVSLPPKMPGFNLNSTMVEGQTGNFPSRDGFSEGYWPFLDDVKRCHAVECQELKERHNNKVENLLQKLGELNSRYFEVRSAYDKSLERCRILDTQVAEIKKEMAAQEEWHSQMYLKMYRKGQEAAKFEHADEVLEFAHKAPKRVSVPELLQQLHRTEHDLEHVKELYRCELYCRKGSPAGTTSHSQQHSAMNGLTSHSATNIPDRQAEYTLKFLKDAVYYYLTEKDNRGHLKAIESILGFSDKEKLSVAKAARQKNRLM